MKGSTVNEIEDNLVQQEAEWRRAELSTDGVMAWIEHHTMRLATDADRARLAELERERVLALGKEMDIPIPGTTTVSLDLKELGKVRRGLVRYNPDDEALYRKLCRAETRLNERLNP